MEILAIVVPIILGFTIGMLSGGYFYYLALILPFIAYNYQCLILAQAVGGLLGMMLMVRLFVYYIIPYIKNIINREE